MTAVVCTVISLCCCTYLVALIASGHANEWTYPVLVFNAGAFLLGLVNVSAELRR